MLQRVPHSPLGLALLADACEAARLDAELALTLEELAGRVASRARGLGPPRACTRARRQLPSRRHATRSCARSRSPRPGSEARREALLWLADLDLANGDGARAELWLERLGVTKDADVQLRRAEARLLQNDLDGARAVLDGLEADPDGRTRRAPSRSRARDRAATPQRSRSSSARWCSTRPARARRSPRRSRGSRRDETTRAKVRVVVEGRGRVDLARWKAAFARAEGRRDEARAALVSAVRSGDTSAARPLLDASLEDQDHASLAVALARARRRRDDRSGRGGRAAPPLPCSPARPGRGVRDPRRARRRHDGARTRLGRRRARGGARDVDPDSGAPERLDQAPHASRSSCARRSTRSTRRRRSPSSRSSDRARCASRSSASSTRARARSSTPLIGADVAPTGVLPTTATLHHLRYAPDPFARIQFHARAPTDVKERIVPSSELRAALKASDPTG